MSNMVNSVVKSEDHLHLVYSDSVLSGRDDHSSYFVTLPDGQDEVEDEDDDDVEPPTRKCRRSVQSDDAKESLPSLQQVLSDLNKSMCRRLDSIESKLRMLDERTKYVETQVGELLEKQCTHSLKAVRYPSLKTSSGAIVIGLPQERSAGSDEDSSSGCTSGFDGVCTSGNSFTIDSPELCSLGPHVTLITLNTADDYPNGCWLGNEEILDQRVRVPISQSDLLHIESNSRTPEKMALALLDYLFDRDTQACSNLSGLGRHGKKKLDPLFIYGMRCHLVHRFGITERDWHRIKLNVDSKCRTAFRRKIRGQPLTVKAFRGKAASTYVHVGQPLHVDSDEDTKSMHGTADSVLQINEGGDMTQTVQLLTNNQFQVIAATPEQVARLKPRIQLVQDGQYISGLSLGAADGLVQGVALSTDDNVSIVTTENGDMIQIMPDTDVSDTIGQETSDPQSVV